MALFSRKQKEEQKPASTAGAPAEKKAKAVKAPARERAAGAASDYSGILKRARITEKATMQGQGNVYTFDVAESATKRDIVRAVTALYKVTPRAVRVVRIPAKQRRSMRTGQRGVSSGGKKAYVSLKSGDTITTS